MRVLFYIEPVVFRLDPFMLTPWIEWIAQIIQQQNRSPQMTFGLASNSFLCSKLNEFIGSRECTYFSLNFRLLLKQFEFDRHAYGRDLYREPDEKLVNDELVRKIREIDLNFQPDIVISFTQNRYIEKMFEYRPHLFWELGPLPRMFGSNCLFMDPMGHQTNSLPNRYKERILAGNITASQAHELDVIWQNSVTIPRLSHELTSSVRQWIQSIRDNRRIVAIALQPPDWLTQEAAWKSVAADSLLMRWLDELPEGWLAVPLFHPGFRLPANAQIAIANEFENVRFPPVQLSSGLSELFLPYVDAIATISSSLAAQGLLDGLPVITYGKSQFGAFTGHGMADINRTAGLKLLDRAKLLSFISNKYCYRLSDCLSKANFITDILDKSLKFDDFDRFFDLKEWKPNNLSYLMQLE